MINSFIYIIWCANATQNQPYYHRRKPNDSIIKYLLYPHIICLVYPQFIITDSFHDSWFIQREGDKIIPLPLPPPSPRLPSLSSEQRFCSLASKIIPGVNGLFSPDPPPPFPFPPQGASLGILRRFQVDILFKYTIVYYDDVCL